MEEKMQEWTEGRELLFKRIQRRNGNQLSNTVEEGNKGN